MNIPKHSIVVPAYNTGAAIRKCVDSILAQSFNDWELIIVNDGSTDTTHAIVDEYAKADSRIKAIHIPNGGVANARNVGMAAANGEYIMFVDGDDWIESDYLKQVEMYMADNADMYIIGITQDHEDQDGRIYYSEIKGTPIHRHITNEHLPSEIGYLLNTMNMESSCLKSYRASFLRKYNIQFLNGMIVFEDFYFVLQCLLHKPSISLIPFIGYHYRMELSYNPVARRGFRDLYPSISNLFVVLNGINNTLSLTGYSHTQVMKTMASKIAVVFSQSNNASTWAERKKPFRQIMGDTTLQANINDILCCAGGRFRLQYKMMRRGMYGIAYLLYKYI